MSYATLAQFAALGLPEAYTAALTATQLQAHLDAAYGKINAAITIGARYGAPLTTFGEEVPAYECDIAAWSVLKRKGYNPENPGDAAVLKGYEEAREWLDKLEKGGAISGVDSTPSSIEQGAVVASASVSSATDPRGWYGTDATRIP